jgi:hypothetical protein
MMGHSYIRVIILKSSDLGTEHHGPPDGDGPLAQVAARQRFTGTILASDVSDSDSVFQAFESLVSEHSSRHGRKFKLLDRAQRRPA